MTHVDTQKQIQERRNRRWIGRELEVLVEGPSKTRPANWTGRTPEHRVVNFPGPAVAGELRKLRIMSATAFSLWAGSVRGFACPTGRAVYYGRVGYPVGR